MTPRPGKHCTSVQWRRDNHVESDWPNTHDLMVRERGEPSKNLCRISLAFLCNIPSSHLRVRTFLEWGPSGEREETDLCRFYALNWAEGFPLLWSTLGKRISNVCNLLLGEKEGQKGKSRSEREIFCGPPSVFQLEGLSMPKHHILEYLCSEPQLCHSTMVIDQSFVVLFVFSFGPQDLGAPPRASSNFYPFVN
jgi:hypothetical protein